MYANQADRIYTATFCLNNFKELGYNKAIIYWTSYYLNNNKRIIQKAVRAAWERNRHTELGKNFLLLVDPDHI